LHEFISHQKLFGRYTLIKLASKEIAIALHGSPEGDWVNRPIRGRIDKFLHSRVTSRRIFSST